MSIAFAIAILFDGDFVAPWRLVRERRTFTDVAASAGLTVPSTYGGTERKRFIIETNGAGAAWIDVDDDGWLDALVLGGTRLIDGQRVEDPAVAAAGPTTRLYRNRGDGTFSDITARSGLGLTVWASSVCGGDYDNDGHVDLVHHVVRTEPPLSIAGRRAVRGRHGGSRSGC